MVCIGPLLIALSLTTSVKLPKRIQRVGDVAAEANGIVFLPDGRWLSSSPYGLRLWQDGRPVRGAQFSGFPSLVISSAGDLLWGARASFDIRRWTKGKDEAQRFLRLSPPGTRTDFWHVAPDGRHAALHTNWLSRRRPQKGQRRPTHTKHLLIVDLNSRHQLERLPRKGNAFVAWSKDRLAAVGLKGQSKIDIFSRETFEVVANADFGEGYVNNLMWSQDGALLFAKSNRNRAAVFGEKGARVATYETEAQIWSWDVHPSGRFVVMGTGVLQTGKGQLEVWTVEKTPRRLAVVTLQRRPEAVRIHPDGRQVFVALVEGVVGDHRIAWFALKE